jgi:hypothetical protein
MVFIELARVSEISAPHKFDRSILKSIDLLNIRSIYFSIDRINIQSIYFFSTSKNPAFLCIFALKIVIFLLLPCKTQKTLKLTKTSESNKAKMFN